MTAKPLYLTKNLRDQWLSMHMTDGTDMSADGILTKDGLAKLIAHFTRFRDYPKIHPSWYQGAIPKDVEVHIWDGILDLRIPLDWAPCSPLLTASQVYDVPRSQANMFVDGSILKTHLAAKIQREFVDPSCIFTLMENNIVPYLGDTFIGIRSNARSECFSSDCFDNRTHSATPASHLLTFHAKRIDMNGPWSEVLRQAYQASKE